MTAHTIFRYVDEARVWVLSAAIIVIINEQFNTYFSRKFEDF